MNLPARVGLTIIAGLLACGLIPAAHAAAAPAPHPEFSTSSTTQTVSPNPPEEVEASSLVMPCQQSVQSTQLKIAFSPEVPFDDLTVTVNDQSVQPHDVQDTSVVLERPASGSTVKVELWEEESLNGECVETVSSATAEPTPTQTSEPPPAPTPTPPESETSAPPVSPLPNPSQTSSSSAPSSTPSKPTFTAPGSASSSPSRAPSNPPMSTEPTFLPDETTERTTQRPHSTAQHRPEPVGPRIIRQFSNDPRYLLPQLLGINTQSGSELIMPRPRNADQGPPDLETLPPVSEDELDAIKARLSSPDRADQPPGDHLAAADERIADRTSNALLPSLLAAVCLGTAIFWLRKRRQRKL